jgi:hypothetical protein
MKCFNHPEVDANGTCSYSNIAICGKCISRFLFALCEQCLLKHNSNVSKELYLGLATSTVIFTVVTYFMYVEVRELEGLGKSMLMGGLMAGTYWGWRFLTDHLPKLTMGSMAVWYIYFVLKFTGAYFIGLFVGPYQIFRMDRELSKVKRTNSSWRKLTT